MTYDLKVSAGEEVRHRLGMGPSDLWRRVAKALALGWGGRIRTCECRYQKPRRANRRPQKSAADQVFSRSDQRHNKNRDTNRYTWSSSRPYTSTASSTSVR